MAATPADLTICADRPGQATGTCIVPTGHFQTETLIAGWSVQETGGERDTSLTIGETTIKYGLTDRSNLEVDFTPFEKSTARSGGLRESESGIGDVSLLYKYLLTGPGSRFQLAALPFVKIPTAKESLGNGKVEAGLLFPMNFSSPGSPFSVGATTEFDLSADSDGHGYHAGMVQIAAVGYQITDRLSVSGEVLGSWDWDPAGTVKEASTDVSAAFLASNRVQLDAGANFGLNSQTPDATVYAGFSILF